MMKTRDGRMVQVGTGVMELSLDPAAIEAGSGSTTACDTVDEAVRLSLEDMREAHDELAGLDADFVYVDADGRAPIVFLPK